MALILDIACDGGIEIDDCLLRLRARQTRNTISTAASVTQTPPPAAPATMPMGNSPVGAAIPAKLLVESADTDESAPNVSVLTEVPTSVVKPSVVVIVVDVVVAVAPIDVLVIVLTEVPTGVLVVVLLVNVVVAVAPVGVLVVEDGHDPAYG
jgi:hypothetical protein